MISKVEVRKNGSLFENAENLPIRQTVLRCLRNWPISTGQKYYQHVGDRSVCAPFLSGFHRTNFSQDLVIFPPILESWRVRDFKNIIIKKHCLETNCFFRHFLGFRWNYIFKRGTDQLFSYPSLKLPYFQIVYIVNTSTQWSRLTEKVLWFQVCQSVSQLVSYAIFSKSRSRIALIFYVKIADH